MRIRARGFRHAHPGEGYVVEFLKFNDYGIKETAGIVNVKVQQQLRTMLVCYWSAHFPTPAHPAEGK